MHYGLYIYCHHYIIGINFFFRNFLIENLLILLQDMLCFQNNNMHCNQECQPKCRPSIYIYHVLWGHFDENVGWNEPLDCDGGIHYIYACVDNHKLVWLGNGVFRIDRRAAIIHDLSLRAVDRRLRTLTPSKYVFFSCNELVNESLGREQKAEFWQIIYLYFLPIRHINHIFCI